MLRPSRIRAQGSVTALHLAAATGAAAPAKALLQNRAFVDVAGLGWGGWGAGGVWWGGRGVGGGLGGGRQEGGGLGGGGGRGGRRFGGETAVDFLFWRAVPGSVGIRHFFAGVHP